MGKTLTIDAEMFEIVDGKITGITVTDNFGSQHAESKSERKLNSVSATFDGMPVNEFVKLAWNNAKVCMQRASWKAMSNQDFLALEGTTISVNDMYKTERVPGAKVNTIRDQQSKLLMQIAIDEAIVELTVGTDVPEATDEAVTTLASGIYDLKFSAIVEAIK